MIYVEPTCCHHEVQLGESQVDQTAHVKLVCAAAAGTLRSANSEKKQTKAFGTQQL